MTIEENAVVRRTPGDRFREWAGKPTTRQFLLVTGVIVAKVSLFFLYRALSERGETDLLDL